MQWWSPTVVVVAAICVAFVRCNALLALRHNVTKDWYEYATFYQIYPRSFADSDNNGVGDIRGIIGKLPYLKELGVTGTWLSPIFKSPMADFGYDISDFYAVDPTFGTMHDLEELFKAANASGIKVILDFVPNHTSDECDWFQKSIRREGKYTNYYVWHDGKNTTVNGALVRLPPNNWNSVFRGHAWTFIAERGQWYLHQFSKQQPDLNYRNRDVVTEMQNVLRFWLAKGAAGFRVDAINFLFEAEHLRDEPVNPNEPDTQRYFYTEKIYTNDQDETYEMVFDWRALLDEWQRTNGGDTRIMMTEAYTNQANAVRFYGTAERPGAHMPFNFVLLQDLNADSSAADFLRVISNRMAAIPSGRVTNWVMGNHDQARVASRYGAQRIDALTTLVMTLPGIAVTYNGEEIGMVDNRDGITFEETVDPLGRNVGRELYKRVSRDPARTPFQWDDSIYAGFSKAKPWLPVHPNYKWLNLKNQRNFTRSTFKYYKALMELRKDHAIVDGTFEPSVVDEKVLAYFRALDGHGEYLVLINFAEHEMTVNVAQLTNKYFTKVERLQVAVAGADSTYSRGAFVPKACVVLRKFDAVVLKSSATSVTDSISMTVFFVAVCRFILA